MSKIAANGNLVVYPYQAVLPGLTVLTNFTTDKLIAEDPELVKDYAAAIAESLEFTESHDEAARAAIVKHLEIPEDVAANLTLPKFDPKLDIAQITELAELAVKYGTLDTMPDVEKIFVQY